MSLLTLLIPFPVILSYILNMSSHSNNHLHLIFLLHPSILHPIIRLFQTVSRNNASEFDILAILSLDSGYKYLMVVPLMN